MIMKKRKIYMKSWAELHGRAKVVDTDEWYLNLANELLPLVEDFYLHNADLCDAKECGMEILQRITLSCALYLEDCVADAGNWREFIHWHKTNYGRYLPFYPLTKEYLPDEINREDIAFLLWTTPPNDESNVGWSPLDENLMELTELIYGRLDAAFESAPISEHLAPDWLMEKELMQRKRTPLPEALPGEKMPLNVERFLEASKGKPLMYFDSYDALKFFLVHSLKWDDEEDDLLPELAEFSNFVLFGNPKGLLIGPDVATYFADKNNPLYNVESAENEAYEIFCEAGLCPFDLLKYAMEHNLLPDAQFPFENGKALLQENWDFVVRWFYGEFYEAE